MPSQSCSRGDSTTRSDGYTLIELAFATVLLGVLGAGMMQAVFGLHTAFADHQIVAQLSIRAERALDQVTTMAQQAITTDTEMALVKPSGAVFHGMKFRVVDSLAAGAVVYNGKTVFLLGPDAGSEPCAGLIVGRDTTLAALHSSSSGSDSLLGTDDDVTTTIDGIRNVEFLLPPTMAPRLGSMLTIEPDAASSRLLLFTLRVNSQDADGGYVLAQDLVLQRQVALRQ